uniref:sodium- and chloride-dependent taurine transporter-like isoform X1 n=1 Tax=Myxine glutinosa TaxID=7769 RepID=UPI00358EB41C
MTNAYEEELQTLGYGGPTIGEVPHIVCDCPQEIICECSKPTAPQNICSKSTASRGNWSNRLEFILSMVGTFVGLGNVWRFPYLCYKNGGGAFLIPYLILLLTGGIPLFFMEMALGQFTGQGAITSWTKICPLFTGVGYGSLVILSFSIIDYMVILSWTLYFLAHSFTNDLPWGRCNNTWNTPNCVEDAMKHNISFQTNGTNYISPGTEFWERKVLRISNGIDEVGKPNWSLVLCMILAWILTFICILKGVKTSGKVSYITATFPITMLVIMLIRGATLPGAVNGIKQYLYPDISQLAEPKLQQSLLLTCPERRSVMVWTEAATQIFYSYGIGFGIIITCGSYNKYNYNSYKYCLLLSVVNSGTSFLSGFVIFSLLGFMAHEQGVDISDVAESGPGLVFIVYPKAVTMMPFPGLWAVLFFLMILLVGISSQFAQIEGQVTTLMDRFGILRYRLSFLTGSCIISFLLGLTMVTEGGMYLFQLVDFYGIGSFSLLCVVFFECIALAWVYGANRFYKAVENMLGYRPGPWMKWCWMYFTPTIITVTFVYTLVKFQTLVYNKVYHYPAWAHGLGWCMALASILCIPGYVLPHLLMAPGSILTRIKQLMEPEIVDLVTWQRKRLGLLEESH